MHEIDWYFKFWRWSWLLVFQDVMRFDVIHDRLDNYWSLVVVVNFILSKCILRFIASVQWSSIITWLNHYVWSLYLKIQLISLYLFLQALTALVFKYVSMWILPFSVRYLWKSFRSWKDSHTKQLQVNIFLCWEEYYTVFITLISFQGKRRICELRLISVATEIQS